MQWSEPPPVTYPRSVRRERFHCDPHALSAAVAQLVLVRRMRHLFRLSIIVPLCFAGVALAKPCPPSEAKSRFIEHPRPGYPRPLRARHLTGSGRYRLHVDKSGKVTSVEVLRSSGHQELDAEAVKAFSRWRAKPGESCELDMPANWFQYSL